MIIIIVQKVRSLKKSKTQNYVSNSVYSTLVPVYYILKRKTTFNVNEKKMQLSCQWNASSHVTGIWIKVMWQVDLESYVKKLSLESCDRKLSFGVMWQEVDMAVMWQEVNLAGMWQEVYLAVMWQEVDLESCDRKLIGVMCHCVN